MFATYTTMSRLCSTASVGSSASRELCAIIGVVKVMPLAARDARMAVLEGDKTAVATSRRAMPAALNSTANSLPCRW